jgi:hypothetical protein
MVRQQRNATRALEEVNEALLACIREISTELAPIKSNIGKHMEAEWKRILKLNASTRAEGTTHEAHRVALNYEFRHRHAVVRRDRACKRPRTLGHNW